VRDADVKSRLINTVLGLVQDDKLVHELETNISKINNTQAGETIAAQILKTIKK
jgi:hypothetical protein